MAEKPAFIAENEGYRRYNHRRSEQLKPKSSNWWREGYHGQPVVAPGPALHFPSTTSS